MSELVETGLDNGILTVRINRPEARNALSLDLMDALTSIARRLSEDGSVRAVVLTGQGRDFSAGIDLKDPRRWSPNALTLMERRALSSRGEQMCQAWEEIPAITICAIEGNCIGGGLALALATDLRVVAQSATLWLPEVAFGLPLGWGALPRLVRLVGPAKAKQLIVLCDKVTGHRAIDIGLGEYRADDGKAYAEALLVAQRVVQLPQVSVTMSKEAINQTANALNRLSSYMARDQLALAWTSEEARAARERFTKRSTTT